jgi:hypothetical protein
VFKDVSEFLEIDLDDISYATNFSIETGSHHIVVPKYFMNSKKNVALFSKEIWLWLRNRCNRYIW